MSKITHTNNINLRLRIIQKRFSCYSTTYFEQYIIKSSFFNISLVSFACLGEKLSSITMSAPAFAALIASSAFVTSTSIFLLKDPFFFCLFNGFLNVSNYCRWLSLIKIISSKCSLCGSPLPTITAFLSK